MVVTSSVWDNVMEMTKSAQDKGCDPFTWAIQLYSNLNAAGVQLPSTDLAQLLVSHICLSNNVPIAWKYLEKAVAMKIAPPMLVLALLSSSVIQSRKSQPTAYRLYLELLKRHAFSFPFRIDCQNYEKIMKSIDEVLNLSLVLALPTSEPGPLIVGFVFTVVWQLLDASLDDEGLLELTEEKRSRWLTETQDMEIDSQGISDEKKVERHENMRKINTVIAVETIGELFENKVTSKILYLACRNMYPLWGCFIQNLRLLAAKSAALRSSKAITPEALLQLTSDTRVVLSRELKTKSQRPFHAAIASGSLASSADRSALWLPFDLFLEDAMDGQQVSATSAVEVLAGLVKALQAVNQSSWKDTFLGLWIAALRLVQRERDPSEGPVPRLDTCMCMLLSVATLAVWYIIEEEEISLDAEANCNLTSQRKEKPMRGNLRGELVSSLQQLGDFEGLLTPPRLVIPAANQAAARAMMSLSGITVGSGYLDGVSLSDLPASFSGNLRHLIVEACIAKNLVDTSAYLWPGYVKGCSNQIPRNISSQISGWSSLMKGLPLTPGLVNALVSTPASSLAEMEKIYEIAVNGSDDEKISAATILCGASLTRGWNIQEYTVLLITKLLSPPVPADYSRSESHLLMYAPFLNVLLLGISSIDCVQIFSLHGVVPQLAGTLMPICEVFGSCAPGDEISSHTVFSNAFTLLLKLWRFDLPPLEHVTGDVSPVGSQLTPEYLLLVRNSQLAAYAKTPKDQHRRKRYLEILSPSSTEPIFIDSFPKLKAWYRQHQECIASTLSALVHGNPVHQIVDGLLNMMFRKVNKGSQPQTPATSGASISSGAAEDASLRLKMPAWDLLEAVPFVLDAALTACAHEKLSPRELTTGLKDLADFLPASLATIVSYLSAEVTRGIWKPACMNGTDWPSPAANLAFVEQHINKMLAATGVVVPSLATGESSPATLPFPLAALVSLTITYKLDKTAERYLFLMGPALITLGASCPWPCLPIINSLWVQKAKRWTDFLIFSTSRNVFHCNSDAVNQLLQSCFSSALGLKSSTGGVSPLLGHGFESHFSGGIAPVAPGIVYLRVHRSVRNIMFMSEEIISLLMRSVKDIASSGLPQKSRHGGKYGQVSLAAAMTRVKLAARLGASLVWITGRVGLVQSLIRETLPSWFITDHKPDCVGMVSMLRGYALAYLAVLSGTFAWGLDSSLSPSSSSAFKHRHIVLTAHLGFLGNAMEGKISLGCDGATWRAYVTGFVSLVVSCAPLWMEEVDVKTLKTVAYGLRQWNEEELALALLGGGGVKAMGAAAELIVESSVLKNFRDL